MKRFSNKTFFLTISVALFFSSCSHNSSDEMREISSQQNQSTYPNPIPLSNIHVNGNLLHRTAANFNRLHQGRYLPNHLHYFPNKEYHQEKWPGDMAGRLILTLTLLEQSLKEPSPTLRTIVDELPDYFNENGYLGKVYTPMINEQQLSGHGWLLRGVAEYYLYTGEEHVKTMLGNIVENLVLPTAGEHKNYPIDPTQREESGSYMGAHQKAIGKWILSSDVGCDFIFMDGVIKAYEVLQTEELKSIVDEMINRFLEVDLVGIKAQTHATLTALRSILRYAELTDNMQLVGEVANRFEIYKTEGMTENYENYNWFGRPRWTEPCAVVDSYITAMKLWRLTGEAKYLEDAQLIYYNGMSFEQRYSGAYGSSTCSGAHDPYLKLSTHDNHWCCTMRGGEGLVKAAEYSYFTKNDTLFIPYFSNNNTSFTFKGKQIEIQQQTEYPFNGEVKFSVAKSAKESNLVLAFFVPAWIDNVSISKNGDLQLVENVNQFIFLNTSFETNDHIDIHFEMEVYAKSTINKNTLPDFFTFNYGPLVLGRLLDAKNPEEARLKQSSIFEKAGVNTFRDIESGLILQPVYHQMHPAVRKEYNNAEFMMQMLFKEPDV